MSDVQSTGGIVCRSYAKINLYLDVLRKRDDGFHQLETIFQTVSLFDELICHVHPDELLLDIEGAELPTGEDNLIVRAAHALQVTSGIRLGARFTLTKNIPVAAGLAGGSGNAAAALCALNRLWGLDYPDAQLETIAAELGSDVPYCLYGGTKAGIGRGEQILELESLPETWLVLVHPAIPVSTPTIFGHPELVKSGRAIGDSGYSAAFADAISSCANGNMRTVLFNALETAAFAAYPEIAACKKALSSAGCDGVLMSGSGPTVFGLCASETHAHEVAAQVSGFRTSVVRTVDTGVELREL